MGPWRQSLAVCRLIPRPPLPQTFPPPASDISIIRRDGQTQTLPGCLLMAQQHQDAQGRRPMAKMDFPINQALDHLKDHPQPECHGPVILHTRHQRLLNVHCQWGCTTKWGLWCGMLCEKALAGCLGWGSPQHLQTPSNSREEGHWAPEWCLVVKSLSCAGLFATPWTSARQASLSITNSWSLLKLMSIESVMPSNHLILCCPLLLPPSIFPSIRVFSNESALHIRWPKDWVLGAKWCLWTS